MSTAAASAGADSGWQPVVGWLQYEVSTGGLVRHAESRKVLGQWLSDQGYRLIRVNRPRRMLRVHRLVASAFIENPQGKPCVNHIDHDRSNNAVSNLEWCTQRENLLHSSLAGRMQKDYWKGKRSPNAILTDDQVVTIRSLYQSGNWSWKRLGEHTGISKRAIGRLLKNETYADV
jgi:hypothetical protein